MTNHRLWLIDGHNVIFTVPSLKALQVADRGDEARRALAVRVERFAHARGEKAVIVFDGNDLASSPDTGRGPLVEIAYNRPAEGGADNRIIHLARRCAEQRRPVTVVTDDVSTLAGRLPRAVVHLSVREFWLQHIEKAPDPGVKRVEGDFSEVERELLAYSAAEEASGARAAEPARRPAASGSARQGAPPPASPRSLRQGAGPSDGQAHRDRLRSKREKGRLRQQRRLERRRTSKRRC